MFRFCSSDALPGKEDGSDGTDSSGFCGCSESHEDGTEHSDDKEEGRAHDLEYVEEEAAIQMDFIFRHRRTTFGVSDGDEGLVEDIESDEHESGQESSGEEVTDGDGLRRPVSDGTLCVCIGVRDLFSEYDEDDGRGNDLPESAGCTNGTTCERRVVVTPYHGGEG